MDFSEIHEGKFQGLAAFCYHKACFGNEPPRVRFQRDFLCLEEANATFGVPVKIYKRYFSCICANGLLITMFLCPERSR